MWGLVLVLMSELAWEMESAWERGQETVLETAPVLDSVTAQESELEKAQDLARDSGPALGQDSESAWAEESASMWGLE